MKNRTRIGILLLAFAGVGLLLNSGSNTGRLFQANMNIERLFASDFALRQALVELRHGVSVNQDGLWSAADEFESTLGLLKQARHQPQSIDPIFEDARRDLAASWAESKEILERTSGLTGSLRNSQRAVARAVETLQRAGCQDDATRLEPLLNRILSYAVMRDQNRYEDASAATLNLVSNSEGSVEATACNALRTMILDHASLILSEQSEIDKRLSELAQLDTTQIRLLNTLRQTVVGELERATSRSRITNSIAIAVSLALAVLVFALFSRLDRSLRDIRQINAGLEARVQQRTEELQQVNETLRTDIERRELAERDRDRMEIELRQAQKLEAVGQLAAGVAHEINTPIQFVGDNLGFLQGAFSDLDGLIVELDRAIEAASGQSSPPWMADVETARRTADLAYLKDEVPAAVRQAQEGVHRVSEIVAALKSFTHPGTERRMVDLAQSIETTLVVARNEWKYVAECERSFDPELPKVSCYAGELNQVLLNLIVNASHAIADHRQGDEKGKIEISTGRYGDMAEIRISDTGGGVPEAIEERIYEPFFTTKDVGKGTGQGLAIARNVVVDKHGGTLTLQNNPGHGATFVIRIPIQAA